MKDTAFYVIYHGDDVIATGSKEECLAQLGWNKQYFNSQKYYWKAGYKRKTYDFVILEGEDEDDAI